MINLTYGKSMYGGWYANDPMMLVNLHTESLRELRALVRDWGIYKLAYRRDN